MISIPTLSDVTDILDTDQVMVTNSQGQSYKIAGSELNKRNKIIIASSTTVTGTPLKSGWPVRIYFTADITAANASTTMQINYNNVNYYVKVPKNGALANYVAFDLGGSPAVFKYVQAYTTLELLFDGTQFIIMCNPVVISGTNFSIYADGLKRVDEVTENGTDLVTSHAVAAAIDKVKDIMGALPTDAVLHYSFDEVPDYPDGSADIRLINNNTYNIQSGNFAFQNNGGTTFSNVNGNLQISITGGGSNGAMLRYTYIQNKILKIKINVTALQGNLDIHNGFQNVIQTINKTGTYIINALCNNNLTYPSFYFIVRGSDNSCTFTVEKIYIGEGAYNTPIINNSGNSNNATNNGGLAVQGVSGKGMCFLSANQYVNINYNGHNSNNNLTISVWLNISTVYDSEGETTYKAIVATGAFAGCFGFYRQGNNIGFIARDNTYSREFTVAMDKGNWHLYTAVYNGNTHNYKFYLDGNLKGTSGANIENYSFGSSSWVIWGNDYRGGGTPVTTKQQGTIDDILFFNRALSADEVLALYLNKANTPKYVLSA